MDMLHRLVHALQLPKLCPCPATHALPICPCSNILRLVEALNAFHRYADVDGAATAVHDTGKEALGLLYDRQFPWCAHAPEPNGQVAVQRQHALLWRTAKHKLARTEEEEVLLRQEVVLMLNWLEERLHNADTLRASLESAAAAAAASYELALAAATTSQAAHAANLARAAKQSTVDGRLELLAQEKQRLGCILVAARTRLQAYLPGRSA